MCIRDSANDVILAIDGKRVDGDDMMGNVRTYREMGAKVAVGTPINLEVKRAGQTMTVAVQPSPATRKIHTVIVDPAATVAATSVGGDWLKQKTVSYTHLHLKAVLPSAETPCT